ncbi:hypothetical protein [Paraburkholderia caballeronis]|uniref:Uncharacterized protein n=1 Tax=Paraburkholderia caballeronis TaxID=416943 RepID=A0A1H7MVV1_9BURK|nr:hypothetical protein [Paraburkholderia caballeronis]PXW26415.1 hypothetical protein C7403_104289 [Paraburkholderia caballeronis]PXX01962.1 hypothetical protein C7407_104289 [Paraburkholderia caballeronis]RAK01119.1 hypothetical protein C7409_104289 [Paraburkholderia caballeronis]SEB96923.1 hypothetical protein SAMN05445871_1406 [Paraburkholderia caballeronis]SEL14815.1 hypothetical protein SAMN05192542_105180 [Paraburkholderia caballeronis]
MNTWLALLAAPALVLAVQAANYALVHVACARQAAWPLAALSAFGVLFSAAIAWLAWRRWRSLIPPHADDPARRARAAMLACAATWVGALSLLIQLTMWFPQWLLSPCY